MDNLDSFKSALKSLYAVDETYDKTFRDLHCQLSKITNEQFGVTKQLEQMKSSTLFSQIGILSEMQTQIDDLTSPIKHLQESLGKDFRKSFTSSLGTSSVSLRKITETSNLAAVCKMQTRTNDLTSSIKHLQESSGEDFRKSFTSSLDTSNDSLRKITEASNLAAVCKMQTRTNDLTSSIKHLQESLGKDFRKSFTSSLGKSNDSLRKIIETVHENTMDLSSTFTKDLTPLLQGISYHNDYVEIPSDTLSTIAESLNISSSMNLSSNKDNLAKHSFTFYDFLLGVIYPILLVIIQMLQSSYYNQQNTLSANKQHEENIQLETVKSVKLDFVNQHLQNITDLLEQIVPYTAHQDFPIPSQYCPCCHQSNEEVLNPHSKDSGEPDDIDMKNLSD